MITHSTSHDQHTPPAQVSLSKHRHLPGTSIVETIAMLFVLLFVYAAVSKILDYDKFTAQIGQSPMLTYFSGFVPPSILFIELAIAGMLATQRFKRIALYGALMLMTMFTCYIIAILNFSTYIPCSCGGVLERLTWTEHLVFNIVFIALAAMAIVLHEMKSKKQSDLFPTSS